MPLSILLFLALTLAGTYYVRKGLLERAMVNALEIEDGDTIRSLVDSWPCPINVRAHPLPKWPPDRDVSFPMEWVWEIVSETRETPLLWALSRGDAALVAKCLDRGAEANALSSSGLWSPLGQAAFFNRPDIAKALLDHGADPNLMAQHRTPLHLCAGMTRPEVARALLDHGADVKARDSMGNTPLHAAAENDKGGEEMARLLLAAGADVNARDKLGRTPLHLTVFYCTGVDALFAAGADLNGRDAFDRTPLHYAAEFCRAGYVEIFLAKGADVNARDWEGRTPLALARAVKARDEEHRANRQRVVELLIQAGGAE